MHALQIGLIGDRHDDVVAHRAIPLALGMATEACGVEIEPIWVPALVIRLLGSTPRLRMWPSSTATSSTLKATTKK